MISSVVTHSPKCKVAPAALLELKTACDLFEAAASHGGRAGKFLVSDPTFFSLCFPSPTFHALESFELIEMIRHPLYLPVFFWDVRSDTDPPLANS